jgi:hypothetical protein
MPPNQDVQRFIQELRSWEPAYLKPRYVVLETADQYGNHLADLNEPGRRNFLTFEDVETVVQQHLRFLKSCRSLDDYFGDSHLATPLDTDKNRSGLYHLLRHTLYGLHTIVPLTHPSLQSDAERFLQISSKCFNQIAARSRTSFGIDKKKSETRFSMDQDDL